MKKKVSGSRRPSAWTKKTPTVPKHARDLAEDHPNGVPTHPNASVTDPNEKTYSERTIPPAERTNNFEGDVPALVADSIPSTISSDASLPRPNEPMARSDRPPNSAVLARKSIDAMERMYLEGGWSLSEIGNFFHLSKSTVYGYLAHLISDPEVRLKHEARRQQFHPASNADGGQRDPNGQQSGLNAEPLHPNAAQFPRSDATPSQPTNRDYGDSYSPQIPRINSEVVGAPLPRVIEENNGNGSSVADDKGDTQSQTSMGDGSAVHTLNRISSDQTPRPITITVDPRDPRLQDIFLQLAHMAAARGISFQEYFMSEKCIEDLRDTVFAKTLVTGDGPQFRNNLMTEIRKANAYDKTRRSVGLESPPLDDVGEQP